MPYSSKNIHPQGIYEKYNSILGIDNNRTILAPFNTIKHVNTLENHVWTKITIKDKQLINQTFLKKAYKV